MVVDIANVIAAVGGVGAILSLVWIARRPDPERTTEDDARSFFDRHGHWPDEDPSRAPEDWRPGDDPSRLDGTRVR